MHYNALYLMRMIHIIAITVMNGMVRRYGEFKKHYTALT